MTPAERAGGGCEGAARPDGAHGAAAGAGEPGQDAAREAGTSQSEQAYRTAQMLIAAAADGQLPEVQLELIPFLLNKAVTARLEQGTASVLAAHRLRPVLSAMVIESGKRGKRRRELRPDALESTAAAAGGMWDVSRVKVALERLCSVVLDGRIAGSLQILLLRGWHSSAPGWLRTTQVSSPPGKPCCGSAAPCRRRSRERRAVAVRPKRSRKWRRPRETRSTRWRRWMVCRGEV